MKLNKYIYLLNLSFSYLLLLFLQFVLFRFKVISGIILYL
jgi:integral membrane sensor domain MASE1